MAKTELKEQNVINKTDTCSRFEKSQIILFVLLTEEIVKVKKVHNEI